MKINEYFDKFYHEHKIPLWLITISLLILFATGTVHATLCYQESFNVTNQTGIDGNCNLNYSGYKEFNDSTSNLQNRLAIIYYKPINATNAIWHTKIMNQSYIDFNIPSDCFNNYPDKIILKMYSVHNFYGQNEILLSCANSTYNYTNEMYNVELGHRLYYNNSVGTLGFYYASGWNDVIVDGNWSTGDYAFDAGSGAVNRGVWAGITYPELTLSQDNMLSAIYEESISWNIDCNELWVSNDTSCNGVNYTKQYFDYYNCGTTFNLPLDNGSTSPCSFYYNISDCNDNLCINPIMYNTTCCIVTPVVYCDTYSYELYGLNGSLIQSGLMSEYVNDTYFYMFNQDVGTYYTKICDDSTRQLIVVGDNMIGLTPQTWLLITLILVFMLFMYLAFKFDPLFLTLDGIIFMYFAWYSYSLYQSWFVTVLLGMIGLLFLFVGVFAKLGQTTK